MNYDDLMELLEIDEVYTGSQIAELDYEGELS